MKFEIKSRFDSSSCPCSSGSPTNDEYKTVSKNGAEQISKCGKIPINELIQADAEACRISSIVRRFSAGDASALNANAASYLDLTAAPQDLMDAHVKLAKSREYFEALPVSIRKAYEFNFEKFLSATSDGSFFKDHGESVGLIRKKEVITDAAAE